MTSQEDALARVAAFLDRTQVPYMVIGGIANLVWGEARATVDIDVTVLVPPERMSAFIDLVGRDFQLLVEDPVRFVTETRVLPVADTSGVRIDLVFGLLPFEEEAVRRAASVQAAGRSIRVCTPEDLILMKIISERPQDLDDARAIVRRRLRELDLSYLEPRIREMASLLEREEIQQRFQAWKAEAL
jgi:hypothetical protein